MIKMVFHILTLFPEMFEGTLHSSMLGRAEEKGILKFNITDIRDFAGNKHNRVDDSPYGGGRGMVMQAQPIYDCIMDIVSKHDKKPRIIYMSPRGETLTQKKVEELAKEEELILLCGHYEGVDQRVLDELECEEISVGDYVLTGGELPALIVADAVARMQKGVLPNEDAYSIESHFNGLLEYPQYTRPEVWHEKSVPEILLSGHHANIAKWRLEQSVERTRVKRPDLYEKYMEELEAYLREHPPKKKRRKKKTAPEENSLENLAEQ